MQIVLTLLASVFILACAVYIYQRIDTTKPPFVPEFTLADVEPEALIIAHCMDRYLYYLQYNNGTVYSYSYRQIAKTEKVQIGSKSIKASIIITDFNGDSFIILEDDTARIEGEVKNFNTYSEMIAHYPTLKPKVIHAEVR